MNMKNRNWTIDEVLDPSSKFWDKVYIDVELYLDSLEKSEIEELGKTPFTNRISDFIEYFKSLSPSNQLSVHKDIAKTENLIVDVLWNLISKEDKELLFQNNIEYFNNWIDTCPQELLDVYINKLANGETLSSKDRPAINSIPESASILDIIKSSNTDINACNVSIHRGKIIISAITKEILNKFKTLMLKAGNKLYEYRHDRTDSGILMHSYIFEINKYK